MTNVYGDITQILKILQNSHSICDQTQTLKLLLNSKTHIVSIQTLNLWGKNSKTPMALKNSSSERIIFARTTRQLNN